MLSNSVALKSFAPLEEFASIRGLVFLFGKICLVAAVGFAYNMGVTLANVKQALPTGLSSQVAEAPVEKNIKKPITAYNIISERNLFGKKAVVAPVTPTVAPPTALKLRLVGTNLAPAFAIVEDTAKREQDVFDLNEMVFGKAKLIEILAESVKIKHGGKVETLVIEEGDSGPSTSSGSSDSSISSDGENNFSISEEELNEAMENLPRLLSQARAVPYFKNGVSIGMRLFAIRKGSLYEKLGLKNGDIIKAVNDHNLSDPSEALKIFEALKDERSITVKAERAGADTTLNYEIK